MPVLTQLTQDVVEGVAMVRIRLAVCVLALSFVVWGCVSSDDGVGDAADKKGRGESVFTPFVGALDRAHGLEHVGAEHNRVLDEALRDGERRR